MPKSDWSIAQTIAALPSETIVFFGAQVGWDQTRDRQGRLHCSQCGGDQAVQDGLQRSRLSVAYCAACNRSTYDGTVAMERSGRPIPVVDSTKLGKRERTPRPVVQRTTSGRGTIELPETIAVACGLTPPTR
jgi:hypothetical protein